MPATTTPSTIVTPAPAAFEPIALSGSGAKVVQFTIPEDAAAIAAIAHSGAGNFAVWTVGADGSQQDLLVNTIGKYAGTVLFDTNVGEHSVAMKVEADGKWTIRISPVEAARAWDQTAPLTGTGDDVVALRPPSTGLVTVTLKHTGDGNFAIWAYSDTSTDLLVNEVGSYSGETLMPDGTAYLEITADGAWSVTPG